MRAISCAIISFVFAYLGRNGNHENKYGITYCTLMILISWHFLALAIVLMALGL